MSNRPKQATVILFSLLLVFLASSDLSAQKKKAARKPSSPKAKPISKLATLREEFIQATKDYKAQLEKLRTSYEKSVAASEDRLQQANQLYEQGLISKRDLEAAEQAVAAAKDRIVEVNQRMASADSQIADTLVEAEAEAKLARARPLPRGGFMRTSSLIRYNGASSWLLSDAWRIQRFFLDSFKRPLPVGVFGQGAIHDRWRLDHRNAMDISLHPDGAEGQALMGFLRAQGIPFLAFREAIPGTATGPHIHVGRPSHRY